jgi:hypothetical protein
VVVGEEGEEEEIVEVEEIAEVEEAVVEVVVGVAVRMTQEKYLKMSLMPRKRKLKIALCLLKRELCHSFSVFQSSFRENSTEMSLWAPSLLLVISSI